MNVLSVGSMYITLTGHIHASYITLDETFQQQIRLFDHLLCNIFHPNKTRTFLDDGHLSKYVTNYVASVQYIYTIIFLESK